MSEWRRQALDGIRAGDKFTFSRTFRQDETEAFGDLIRDYNPVHYEPRFAGAKGFPGLICHGLLVGGMICELGGQVGWLAANMHFRFLKPVYFGDTVTCTVTIISISEKGWAEAEAVWVNQDGVRVLEGTFDGYLPRQAEAEVLNKMLAEGDPTNKLAGER